MKLKFSLNVTCVILFFDLWPSVIKLSVFDQLPLEITQKILVHATPEARINLFSTSHDFTIKISILKPMHMKKIIEHMVLQNVFKGNFGTFNELDKEVKDNLPKIIFNDNPTFKDSYDDIWLLYSFCYADIRNLEEFFEKFPTESFRLKLDSFETNQIREYTYQQNDKILYQTIHLPSFNLTSDLAWEKIKELIKQFPQLKRIVVNDIQIKEEEIEKNYPLQYGNVIIQSYPKIEENKPIKTKTETVLHFSKMDYATFKLLLENKVNPNVPNIHGNTPLHQASFEGKLDIVKLLLKYGADPYFKNHMDYTPADRIVWRAGVAKKNGRNIKPEIEETIKFWQNHYPKAIHVKALPKITRKITVLTNQEEPRFLNGFKKHPFIIVFTLVFGTGLLGFLKYQQYHK